MHRSAKTIALSFTLTLTMVLLPQVNWASRTTNQGLWQPPLGLPLRISAPYDLPNGPYQAGHRGIDMRANESSQPRSPADGVVTFVGTVVDRPVISIRVNDRTIVSLEPVQSGLSVGDAVVRGDPLGTVSAGGHCASECLHLGVRIDGNYVNPLRFLVARAVLVPW